ncbi:hypothetical protein ACFE04_024685 [Oxalis oulophora]
MANLWSSSSSLELKILHFHSPRFSFHSIQTNPLSLPTLKPPKAVKTEWQEYEDAVKRKDLVKALKFLKKTQNQDDPVELLHSNQVGIINGFLDFEKERDWQLLDTCLNADDMSLVAAAYTLLKDRGFLPNFGRFESVVLEGPNEVTPLVLYSETGLEASKLSPKKWGVSGMSRYALIAVLAGSSYLVTQGIDIRVSLTLVLGLFSLDSIFLGGTSYAVISSYWPPSKKRIIVHEAGHLLVAYLLGCPIRGVILDPIIAMQMGIQGQAGTQFWDAKMDKEVAEGKLSGRSFDRYCMVLFAGMAAEALIYGEAEGGENDENLFKSICGALQPPLSIPQMSNQARWSVLQSYNLLKWHKNAHRAAVKALESGSSLSIVIRRIEEAMSTSK